MLRKRRFPLKTVQGAPAVIKPVQAEIIPDVPIAKSAAPAATAAATASAVDAKAAQKAQDKARRAAQKAQKKAEKLKARREKQQALIDSCPPQYKPVSTSGFFWLGFISYLPCVGLVITILLSLLPRNKNIKHFERAILIMYLIAVIIALVLGIVFSSLFLLTTDRQLPRRLRKSAWRLGSDLLS